MIVILFFFDEDYWIGWILILPVTPGPRRQEVAA